MYLFHSLFYTDISIVNNYLPIH